MGNTFKEMSGSFCFEADLDDAGPSAAFPKRDMPRAMTSCWMPSTIFDKFRKGMADNLGEWNTQKVGEAAIGGTNFTSRLRARRRSSNKSMSSRKPCCDFEIISKSCRAGGRWGGSSL